LRVFGIVTLVIWALLITIWLAARTLVEVEKGKASWDKLTWQPSTESSSEHLTDTSMTSPDTSLADTMATD
jgi:hypothetical protein